MVSANHNRNPIESLESKWACHAPTWVPPILHPVPSLKGHLRGGVLKQNSKRSVDLKKSSTNVLNMLQYTLHIYILLLSITYQVVRNSRGFRVSENYLDYKQKHKIIFINRSKIQPVQPKTDIFAHHCDGLMFEVFDLLDGSHCFSSPEQPNQAPSTSPDPMVYCRKRSMVR